jgi:hypothetical protein
VCTQPGGSLHVELSNGLYTDIVGEDLTGTFGLTEVNTPILGAVLSLDRSCRDSSSVA